jgi:hypothetical protein
MKVCGIKEEAHGNGTETDDNKSFKLEFDIL